jgi:hypothetical protein
MSEEVALWVVSNESDITTAVTALTSFTMVGDLADSSISRDTSFEDTFTSTAVDCIEFPVEDLSFDDFDFELSAATLGLTTALLLLP